MEIKQISIRDNVYNIVDVFRRTSHSTTGTGKQQIVRKEDKLADKRMTFYKAERNNEEYFIKENNFKPKEYKHDTDNLIETKLEYERGILAQFECRVDKHSISASRYIDYEANRSVQEFLNGYVSLTWAVIDNKEKEIVKHLLNLWIDALPLETYDMSTNNILFKGNLDKGIVLKMVDFDPTPDKNKAICRRIIRSL